MNNECKYIEGVKGRAIRNISGKRFGKLTAICDTGKRSIGSVVWKCVCDCGKKREVALHELHYGYTTTCGDRKCRKDYHEHLPETKIKKEGKLQNRLYNALCLIRENKPEWLIENARIKHMGKKILPL